MTPDVIERLTQALGTLPADSLVAPAADRLGAVLVLVEPRADGETTIVYTRRRDDLRSHPGQISFPGGRVDDGETVEQAAIREAHEEVALQPDAIEVIGRLPAFFIPPSRFWLQSVIAHWIRPHELVAAEAEVAAVLHVPMSRLRDPSTWRTVRLSTAGWSWAWDLGDGHLLWGATALVTAFILGLLDPNWSGGAVPADYAHREVQPWVGERRVTERQMPARLDGIDEQSVDAHLADPAGAPVLTPARVDAAARAVADAALQLADGSNGPVVVLAGSGGTGQVGRAAAEHARAAGMDAVVASLDDPDAALSEQPSVVIDALVGTGLRGPLAGAALAMVQALRLHARPVVSVDLPSGLHPADGMVGDAVSADVTVAVGGVQPGLLLPGLSPFVGDLYVADLDEDKPGFVRVVGSSVAPTWRE